MRKANSQRQKPIIKEIFKLGNVALTESKEFTNPELPCKKTVSKPATDNDKNNLVESLFFPKQNKQ